MIWKDRVSASVVILGTVLFVLAGCAQAVEPTATLSPPTRVEVSPTDTPVVEAPAAKEATPYPDPPTPEPRPTVDYPEPDENEGEALLNERCGIHHAVTRATTKKKTADEWRTTVERMVGKGAELTDAEVETLIQYLAENYGK